MPVFKEKEFLLLLKYTFFQRCVYQMVTSYKYQGFEILIKYQKWHE